MKVTSFEISKKLAEIGFKGETDFRYVKCNNGYKLFHASEDLVAWEVGVNAFCLETILDALPIGIDRDNKRYDLIIEQKMFFSYSYYDRNELEEFYITRKANESLADAAARLLIQLYDAGLIKFKKE